MNSKTIVAREKQRFTIQHNSIFGIWTDLSQLIEFKISPIGSFARVKILYVKDPVVLERLSFYCGLAFLPKRTKWRGFDFITRLVKANEYSHNYQDGVVHMPKTTRKNLANLVVLDNSTIVLDFFYLESRYHEVQQHAGSLILVKSIG